jgi:predicted dehydrogenase
MPDSNGKIRYAVVAGGWISQGAFMPGLEQTDNSVMTALVTGDPVKADELAALYDLKSYHYDEFATLLSSGEIDAIYLATPNFRQPNAQAPS